MTKSSEAARYKAFATLPLSCDQGLAEGRALFRSKPCRYLVGRTGTWFLATDYFVTSVEPERHLDFLTRLLSQRLPVKGAAGATRGRHGA
jgi:hypothetical protein